MWEKKPAAFKANRSVAINSFLRRLILLRLNPFLLLTKDIVYPVYSAILFSWELNLYHCSSVRDSQAKSVIYRCSKGYSSNLCRQLNTVLFGQINLWPGPKSGESGGLFTCYDPGAHVTGRKEGSDFCIDCFPPLSKVLLLPTSCPWKSCSPPDP